jgi:putative tryptophan/tyrosine transport system substrate-binding protein
MTIMIARRKFIAGFGGAALLAPIAARAQPAAPPVIGFLNGTAPDPMLRRVAAFRQGLGELGYVERQNLAIQFRWAESQPSLLPQMVADLVRRRVSVIVTTGGTAAAVAAKQATSEIPIVFEIGGDPVAAGLVDKLNPPGGNVTGVSLNAAAHAPKQIELVRELRPGASLVAILVNPGNPNSTMRVALEAAARAAGLRTLVVNASNEIGLDAPFATMVRERADAVLVSNDAFFFNWRQKIVALAARHALPAIFSYRDYTAAGGLMSYGPSIADAYRQVGVDVGRILKGEKPGDLPVAMASKVELVINLITARTLGFVVPPALLARADEVIQ